MKFKKLSLSVLSVLLLAGCCETTNFSSNGESTSTIPVSLTAMTAIEKLQSKDAEFRSYVSDSDEKVLPFSNYFSKNYVYSPDKSDGYLNENGGVSQFDYNSETEDFSRSELLTDDKGEKIDDYRLLVSDFSDLDLEKATVNDKGIVDFMKGKTNIIVLLKMMGLDESKVFTLSSLTAAFTPMKNDDTVPNGLKFTATFKTKDTETTRTISISRYNEIEFSFLDDFLANPTSPFEPTATEKRIRSLFAKKNYINSNDLNSDDVIDEYYYFTPKYFYTDFTDEYSKIDPTTVGTYGKRGYMTINNTLNVGTTEEPKNLVFIGTYLFYNQSGNFKLITREDPNNPGYAQSAFTQIYTDISQVMNYPTNMECVNSFQKAKVQDDGSIKFTNKAAIDDFITNHFLGEMIETNNLVTQYLLINTDIKDKDEDCKVTFRLQFENDKYYETEYNSFGKGNVDFVEKAIAENDL
ncbi:MAG: hypothetical protein WCS80_01795 [Bacilli bacterium]